jgi:hypothetical protein
MARNAIDDVVLTRAGRYRAPETPPSGEASPSMRMMLPPPSERRLVDRWLVSFFRDYALPDFNRAVSALCRFYHLARPRVEWFEYLDWGTTAGRTYENGKIHLVHPENWKRGRKYNSERQWIQTVHHEMAHFLFWADAERKADTFARRMVRGLQNHARTPRSNGRLAVRNGHARRLPARRVRPRGGPG